MRAVMVSCQENEEAFPLSMRTIDDTIEYWNKLVMKGEAQDRAKEKNIRVLQSVCNSILDKLEGVIQSLDILSLEKPSEPKRFGASNPEASGIST